ncbi:MAG: MBL fold metallo-hydrolase [Verrucomicrobia bacterium]|nr:MBL fold metallo-hydrolase [Verrucomicrobiota bacterium]
MSIAESTTEGPLPEMKGWRWIFTPGHSPGHISLFREADRTLLAGDAVATMNLNSYVELAVRKKELAIAGFPFICNWESYRRSLDRIAQLNRWRWPADTEFR